MASTIIGAVLALLKAVPYFDSWFKALYQAYFEMKVASHDREFLDAHMALIAKHDQRKLEKAIGSENAGKPDQDQTDVKRRPNK